MDAFLLPPAPRLAVSNLRAYYYSDFGPIHAVDDVSFDLFKGECLAIVGESGSGKSTLALAIIRGLQYPGRIIGGKISLNDIEISQMNPSSFDKQIRWKKIAMIFQGAMNSLDPVYPIGKQMYEILKVHGSVENNEAKIHNALSSVGLERDVVSYYPHELSGGMKQRIVIAMALLLEPEVLIADEPTTALDVLVQKDIIELLKRMQIEKGISILIISHDFALMSQLADRIAIMYAGQIVEIAPSGEICTNPKHPYTRALLTAIPSLASQSKILKFISGNPPSLLNPVESCRFRERCREALDICSKNPPQILTSTGGVRCWLYDPGVAVSKHNSQH